MTEHPGRQPERATKPSFRQVATYILAMLLAIAVSALVINQFGMIVWGVLLVTVNIVGLAVIAYRKRDRT